MIGYHKKKNGYGSWVRVKSYYTKSKDFAAMEAHAKKEMWTNQGLTAVLYFNDRANTPDVTYVGLEFDKRYEPYCIAGYWKYPNVNETFLKYPFKDK